MSAYSLLCHFFIHSLHWFLPLLFCLYFFGSLSLDRWFVLWVCRCWSISDQTCSSRNKEKLIHLIHDDPKTIKRDANRTYWESNPQPQSSHKAIDLIGRHLFALRAVRAAVRQLPAYVEQHVVLTRSPSLHEVGGEHPGPEDDAVILKTAWKPPPTKINQ